MSAGEQNSPEAQQLKIYCHKCRQKLDVANLEPFSKVDCPTCGIELIVPKWFSTYLLEEKCGQGGSAEVYRALDVTLDREVAIKIFPEQQDPAQFSKVFLHEGRIAANLSERGIVPIYSCGQFEGHCFLIMQYMRKGSLRRYLKENPEIPISRVLSWMVTITSALKAALASGVIHHDIKPANMLLDSESSVKLADFGLSHALHDLISQSLATELSSYGSPDYVSPEKLSDGFEDEKGDIFSLGVTIYELLSGRKPFKHANEGEDILEVRKRTPAEPLNKLRPEISLKLSKFITRMLDDAPACRPEYDKIIAQLKHFEKKYKKYEGKYLYKFISRHL